MLSNRLYLGETDFRDVVVPDAHEQLTDPDTFEQCQRILTARGETHIAEFRLVDNRLIPVYRIAPDTFRAPGEVVPGRCIMRTAAS
jgi:hypothetical protein